MIGLSPIGVTPIGATSAASGQAVTPPVDPPIPDTTAPTFASGATLTMSAIATTGAHAAWPAASDNVAVAGYEFSCDTGTPLWVDVGNVLAADPAGLAPSTDYTVRVRAYDNAGNRSAALTQLLRTADLPVDPGQPGTIQLRLIPLGRSISARPIR